MPDYTMVLPVEGICDDGCPFYVEGSSEPGEHCLFKVLREVYPNCGATERNPEA